MANESIRAAFERMWQHTVAKIENEVAGLDNGANVLVVTTTLDEESGYRKASHTPKQIYDHIQSGGIAVLEYDTTLYNLLSADEEHAFFWALGDDLTYYLLVINNSCECSFSDQQAISWENVSIELMQVITVDENNAPSMTSQEIYNIVSNGGRVVLKYDNRLYSLASCKERSAYFNYYDETYTMHCVEIYNNQFRDCGILESASTQYVLDQLGPIDEALDYIRVIQQSLIDYALQQAEGVEF